MKRVIVIDARRKLNSGIGRIIQWLVNNLETTDAYEFRYLVTYTSKTQYEISSKESIVVNFNPFSVEEYYKIPKIISKYENAIFLSTQVNCTPFNLGTTISMIHDVWFLTNIDSLPSVQDAVKRFSLDNGSLFLKFSEWLNFELAENILTKDGLKIWSKVEIQENIIAKYFWSQLVALTLFSQKIVFVHEDVKVTYQKLFKRKDRLFVIDNVVSKMWQTVEIKAPRHFLCLAKLEHRKSILELLKGYEIYAKSTESPFKLIIAGDKGYSEYANQVLSKIETMNADSIEVEFIESTNDETLKNLFSETAALVMCSKYESYGLPTIEALSAGIPVISTKTGMMRFKLGNFANLISDYKPQSISQSLLDLHTNLSHHRKMAKENKKFVNSYIDAEHLRIKNNWNEIFANSL